MLRRFLYLRQKGVIRPLCQDRRQRRKQLPFVLGGHEPQARSAPRQFEAVMSPTVSSPVHCAGGKEPPRFVVTGEISSIYKRGGKTRKVHNLILLPSLEAADELSARLEAVGNIRSDGRPILGLDSRDLLELTLEACPDAELIPAHIWTPHFAMFGAICAGGRRRSGGRPPAFMELPQGFDGKSARGLPGRRLVEPPRAAADPGGVWAPGSLAGPGGGVDPAGGGEALEMGRALAGALRGQSGFGLPAKPGCVLQPLDGLVAGPPAGGGD